MPSPDYVELKSNPEERLRLVEENVRDYAIFVVDPDGFIASWNVGAERILGYSEAEAIGMNCAEIFTPEDRQHGAVEAERGKARDTGRAEDERWHLRRDGSRFWGNGIMTALYDEGNNLKGFVKILRDETQRRAADAEQERAQEQRIVQERQIAVLEERNRMAQEIHDTLAQSLTAITLQLEAAKDDLPEQAEEALARINRAQELAREGLAETRRSVWALRPQTLEQNSLAGAFARLVQEIRAATTLTVSFKVDGTPIPLPASMEDHLLRICQEALTNVLRHANAAQLQLTLGFEARAVRLQIQDDGNGFHPQQQRPGFGLTGMRERAESQGGHWALTSEPGKGTRIEVTIPLGEQEP